MEETRKVVLLYYRVSWFTAVYRQQCYQQMSGDLRIRCVFGIYIIFTFTNDIRCDINLN